MNNKELMTAGGVVFLDTDFGAEALSLFLASLGQNLLLLGIT